MVEKNFPKISVIVACYNEERFIETCINSLISQDYKGEFEILIVDGGSQDNTLPIIQDFNNKHNNIKIFDNPQKYQSSSRNIAIKNSDSDFVAYIDAHRIADKSWLSNLWSCYEKFSGKDNLIAGVGSIHLNAAKNSLSEAQEIAFKSILSGATSSNFLNYKSPKLVDHSCMMLYKKEILENIGAYREELIIGEDIELNHRLNYIYGYRIYLNPAAVNYYFYRETLKDLFKQQFNYGKWRQIVFDFLLKELHSNKFTKNQNTLTLMRIKTMVPGIFVFCLIIMMILSLFSSKILLINFTLLAIYLITITLYSVVSAIKYKLNSTVLIAVFIAIHFGYGLGVLSYFLKRKKILHGK